RMREPSLKERCSNRAAERRRSARGEDLSDVTTAEPHPIAGRDGGLAHESGRARALSLGADRAQRFRAHELSRVDDAPLELELDRAQTTLADRTHRKVPALERADIEGLERDRREIERHADLAQLGFERVGRRMWRQEEIAVFSRLSSTHA